MSKRTNPLCIDLFCGLGGWTSGFLANGYDCVGFDMERHQYWVKCEDCDGTGNFYRHDEDGDFLPCDCYEIYGGERAGTVPKRYPAQLVLQDVLTLHGSQFKDAACIVASPPCQEYSYMAMPFSRGKQKAKEYREGTRNVADLTRLFDACFRIQREASEAAGRHIPMVVENVKGAQPWVGPAKAHFGSFYLWGDVESVGGRIVAGGLRFGATLRPATGRKSKSGSWDLTRDNYNPNHSWDSVEGVKVHGQKHGEEYAMTRGAVGTKAGGDWFGPGEDCSPMRKCSGSVKVPSESGRRTDVGNGARFTSRDCGVEADATRGTKGFANRFEDTPMARHGSASPARKTASAMIAEIPFALSDWLARCFHPDNVSTPQRTKYPVRASA